MKRIVKILLVFMLSLGTLTGCWDADLAKQRAKEAGQGDDIIIGVPVPRDFTEKNTGFLKGLELALEDINSRGVNNKKVKLEIVDDRGVFKNAVDIAQGFSENTRMTAVIGHWFSDICIPVSSIYEESGLLVVVPTVSNTELAENNYRYIFQNVPSDKKVAEHICLHAKNEGFKHMVIYYEDSSYGWNLADAFEKEAKNNGIKIVDRCSDMISEIDLRRAHDKWTALDFDAVFLALNMPEGGQFIKEFRKLDPRTPILSGDGLDVSNIAEALGGDGEGVVMATIYNPLDGRPELKEFKERYRQKYGEEPDVWAIQGYDSLQLITRAIEETDSCSPAVLADYLRNMKSMRLVAGDISFNDYGEVQGREVYKKKIVNGELKYID
ncbi:ABC transporter substrate-binding protein [Desulfoscipio sp. XC116]|uniref:ABC transporter substrate-binding protein n=1 Tax=Desulfoscipio sp. XC116 TaxID=3144975 RepID=UPI00325BB3F8